MVQTRSMTQLKATASSSTTSNKASKSTLKLTIEIPESISSTPKESGKMLRSMRNRVGRGTRNAESATEEEPSTSTARTSAAPKNTINASTSTTEIGTVVAAANGNGRSDRGVLLFKLCQFILCVIGASYAIYQVITEKMEVVKFRRW